MKILTGAWVECSRGLVQVAGGALEIKFGIVVFFKIICRLLLDYNSSGTPNTNRSIGVVVLVCSQIVIGPKNCCY